MDNSQNIDLISFRNALRKEIFILMKNGRPVMIRNNYQDNFYSIWYEIWYENRRTSRINITKDKIILRTPLLKKENEIEHVLNWVFDWLEQAISENASFFDKFKKIENLPNYLFIKTIFKDFHLHLNYHSKKTNTAEFLPDNNINFNLSNQFANEEIEKVVGILFSKIVANEIHQDMLALVNKVNKETFNINIDSIRLSYTYSKWGSCSYRGDLHFSTRLVFAPFEVIRHVIIHELAHRIEFNHSSKFWALVSKHDPDHKEHKKWLREYNTHCDITF